MRISLLCFLSPALAFQAGASTFQLVGDNSKPGMLAAKIDSVNISVFDYTGQRHASQGQTWNVNIYTFSTLSQAYYSPADPYIRDGDYLTDYKEEIYLFNTLQVTSNAVEIAKIQQAAYHIFDPTHFGTNSYVTLAENEIATNGVINLGDLSAYRFYNSPFTNSAGDLKQGFISKIDRTTSSVPEPGTASLFALGGMLLAIGAACKKVRE